MPACQDGTAIPKAASFVLRNAENGGRDARCFHCAVEIGSIGVSRPAWRAASRANSYQLTGPELTA